MKLNLPSWARLGALVLVAGLAVATTPRSTGAHEIPNSVIVNSFIRAQGNTLRMLVRVPLASMRDIQFPIRGPGYINISEADPYIRDAAILWIADYVRLFEDDQVLGDGRLAGARISLPSDVSFTSYESAEANILGPPLPEETELIWQQAFLDVMFEYPIQSDESRFAIESELAHLGISTTTVLRFDLPGSEERVYQFTGAPGRLELDPRWHQAALRFVAMGFGHILDGIDHLLFLLCLVIPFRRIVPLLTLVTAFTIAHSITLIASALGYAPAGLWFPPWVETLIAASILFMALENLAGAKLQRRWMVAFGFGLVHGFGFSFALRESLQFAGGHLMASLFAFNVGVELGQIAVLLVTVPTLVFLFDRVVAERAGVIILSALIAHTAWHWMAERWEVARQYQIQMPPLDAIFLLGLIRWTMAILALIGVGWILKGVFDRLEGVTSRGEVAPGISPEA